MIFSSHQRPCTYCFPLQLLLLHHHCHKVLQWSQAHKLCFTRTWEHEGLALENFSYKIAFGDMAPAGEESSFSLPSSLKALALTLLHLRVIGRNQLLKNYDVTIVHMS